jgi:hypothetical protein
MQVSINTRVRSTDKTVEWFVNHLFRFHFKGCPKEVINLNNRPVVSRLDTRVSGTSAEVVPPGSIWNFLHNKPMTAFPQGEEMLFIINRYRGKVNGDEVFLCFYESIKWELKIKPIYQCRCDERLQTKTKRFMRLTYTGLVVELEHLKIKTRLTHEKFVSVMGEGVI